MRLNWQSYIKKFSVACLILCSIKIFAINVPIYNFKPAYKQNIHKYISKNDNNYYDLLLKPNYQKKQLNRFYNHYFSTAPDGLSPWSAGLVNALLPQVEEIETRIINTFNYSFSKGRQHFSENYQEKDVNWLSSIVKNMNLPSENNYQEKNRAIATSNTFARALPDCEPDFFDIKTPGQGFPFDNLQASAIWAGTPLYILSTTKDKAWSLILTPDAYIAWVKTSDIAYASPSFIAKWKKAAQKKLVAITKTKASILDTKQQFQFSGYIGAIYPSIDENKHGTYILIPFKNRNNQAEIKIATVRKDYVKIMPLPATRANIASIIKQLQNRPYGWGGIFFLNDCSQEIKSLFTPFGIWLPRNSVRQSNSGQALDLSSYDVKERINILKSKGRPLITVIYTGGHEMLFVGNEKISKNESQAITYQNIWGLVPKTKDKRYVIGRSLFFPLLEYYPEKPDIHSQADKKSFKLLYLDELSSKVISAKDFVRRYFIK
jgi:cell wall-associated NlpC family hydrolase